MTKDGPIWLVTLAVGSGAGIGAMLRWALSYKLNGVFSWFPLGTYAANTLGGFLCGLALAWTATTPSLSPIARLFVITGFLGGLTTFSTFSGEAFSLLLAGEALRAGTHVMLHVATSLLATWAGWTIYRAIFHAIFA